MTTINNNPYIFANSQYGVNVGGGALPQYREQAQSSGANVYVPNNVMNTQSVQESFGVHVPQVITGVQASQEINKTQELNGGDSVVNALLQQGYSINHLNGLAPSKAGWIA